MADTSTIPSISFQNDLSYDIVVYDSFDDSETDSDTNTDDNYFGTLTTLGTVAAKSAASIQPIHKTSAFIVESVPLKKPVKRCTKLGTQKTITSFLINQDDENAMNNTFNFIDFYLKNPNDSLSKAFTTLLTGDPDALYSGINDFFKQQTAYSNCTFPDYMMAITYNALTPQSATAPPADATYSLMKLVISMGAPWPTGMPDIILSKFSCTNKNSQIIITGDVDVTSFSFESADIANNVSTLLGSKKIVTVKILFNYAFGLGIFGTRLSFLPDSFTIPAGSDTINVTKPAITFDITPLFKFVKFTVSGVIPFDINTKKFDADISLAVDNDEASIGVVIEGDNSSFPPPPGLKGLFFDQFGVGIGVFFKPPACIVGVQGKFHIGDMNGNNLVSLDDDTFALICKITGEAITPAFASFYIPKLDLNTVIELFTNVNLNLDVPVSFQDLSFRWVDEMMSAYVLPDGTLTEGGYGFSAACNVASFGFYGDVELDLNNGLKANVEVSPVNLGNVFTLSGDGTGFFINVDANGNPIRNNFIPVTQAEKDAVKNAAKKQIVTAGGPSLIINTLTQPILHLNAKASLFDLANFQIQADINKSGITFLLDYGAVLKEKMTVTLADFHNLAASFTYYINQTITVPTVAGVRLGSFQLAADVETHFGIATSLSDVKMNVGGSFNFEGLSRTFGDFTADIQIKKITDFLTSIGKYIEQEAKQIFSDFLNDAQQWANKVKSGFITGADEVGTVLKNAWKADSIAVASIMKNAGYAIDEISSNIKNAWSCTTKDVTYALKAVGYTADEVAKSLKNIFNATSDQVADALKSMGYSANEIGSAIKNCWNCGVNDVTWAMQQVGFDANSMCNALKNAFNASAQDVANSFKTFGIAAQDATNAIKNVYNLGINDAASVLKQAGYAATDVASALKNAFNTSADAVASAMKAVGYAGDEVKNAFESLGGDFKNFADSAWQKLSDPDTWNPSKW